MNAASFFSRRVTLGAAALIAALWSAPVAAAPITFDLTGANDQGSVGNVRTFNSGGITLTATAWSYSTSFQPGALGRWSLGLGVCDQAELSSSGGCTSPEHEVDNNGYRDYVLFQFSSPVDPLSVSVTTVNDDDLDASYFVGTLSLPADRLKDDTYASLATRGFGARLDNDYSGSSDSRTVTLTSGFVTGLLFGAREGSSNDGFKISQLVVDKPNLTVPEPASMLLFGFAALGIAPRLRRRLR
jgi:hypothetical protein